MSSTRVFVAALCFSLVSSAALADGPTPYQGSGTVYVIEDGRVAIEYASGERAAEALLIDRASEHFLITNGTTASILAPGVPVPSGTTSKIKLAGTGCNAVGQYAGTLTLRCEASGNWRVQVAAGNVTTFDYLFDYQAEASMPSGGCVVHCPQGSCSASGPGINWCFCGLFGEPHCVHIGLAFAVNTAQR